MMRSKLWLGLMLSAFVCVAGFVGHASAANIVIVNNDGAGEGFNDPTVVAPVGGNWGTTLGQQRLIAFEYAAGIWAGCLASNVTIEIQAQFDPLFCNAGSATLGSAGTTFIHRDFAGAPLPATWYSQALANSLAGFHLNPGTPDINATFNSNINGNPACLGGLSWYYGLDGNPGADIDFVTVLLHEMGHGLGFQTFVSQTGAKFNGFNDQYMIYLENHGAVPADYPTMNDAQRAAGNIGDPNLHWTGPIVTAEGNAILVGGIANGHVRMHGPNPYQPGSSVSHWSTALTPNELMEPSYTGPNHDVSLALDLMDEIGWALQAKATGCPGSVVDLASPSGPPTNTNGGGIFDSNQGRGVFFTAIKDFDLCAFGMKVDHFPGQTITANLYAANGTTRGALLATGTLQVPVAGPQFHYVPITYSLKECEEYDLEIFLGDTFQWDWWSEFAITEPFDVGGVIRVRDGEQGGAAGNTALPHFSLIGSAPSADNQTNVAVSHNCNTSWPLEHGAFVTAMKTQSICALGVRATITVAPTTLKAYVYEASGTVRGALVAEGEIDVTSTSAMDYDVPINAVLEEGKDYNIGFFFGEASHRSCRDAALEGGFPWAISDLMIANSEEVNGIPVGGNDFIPAFRIAWNGGAGGDLLDLSETFQGAPPLSAAGAGFEAGLFMTANVDVNAYSFGIDADFPAGATMTARVYSATGTTRGALVTEGTITTNAGDKWHDVPLSVELAGGNDYEFVLTWDAVNLYTGWSTAGLYPVNAYGLFELLSGSFNGGPISEQLLYRIGACTNVVTGVGDGPVQAPLFTLKAPYPNPISSSATLGYSLDKASTVTIAVYDVAGRKVADLVQDQSLPVGPGEVSLDGANFPSGVYFVKMSTPTQSVSRKITIVR